MKKKILFVAITFFSSVFLTIAQDRVDSEGYNLHYKSQELKKAKYWSKGSSGKLESRKNNLLDDGVNIRDNFLSLYFGMTEYEGEQKIIFYKLWWKGEYKYPNIKADWINYKTIKGSIISLEQYQRIKNIQQGEIIELTSTLSHDMWVGHSAYNENTFLEMLLLFESSDKLLGEQKIDKTILIVNRTTNDGKDVIRFKFDDLSKYITGKIKVDNFYFEVPKKDFDKLFILK